MIGEKAEMIKSFTQEEVNNFIKISLDNNPIHYDKDYASSTIFEKPIVHGMLVSSLISAVIGTKLPGKGTIYLGQNLKFVKPVYVNEKIKAVVEVLNKKEQKPIYTLLTTCFNEKGEEVIKGEAVIMFKKINHED